MRNRHLMLIVALVGCHAEEAPVALPSSALSSPAELPIDEFFDEVAFALVDEAPEVPSIEEDAPPSVGDEALPEPHAVAAVARFKLRRGETPSHFARWSGLPVEVIAEASGLSLGGTYPVGTEIRVPADPERQAELERAREAHHARRAEGYLASRGGARGTEFYTVRTGDTAWSIAMDAHGIPVWLLETYNPSVDLERLRPGQDLMVPILADTVADGG